MVPELDTPLAVVLGLGQFALLVVVGEVTGLGLLTLLRTPADWPQRILLAPFAATLVWSLTGTLFVRAGFTMAHATPIIAAISLGLAIVGITAAVRARALTWAMATLAGGLGVLVVAMAWPYFARGLGAHLGSANRDTFYYTIAGTGLWHFGLDATAAPSTFFQDFAQRLRGLSSGRNNTFVLLAFFSPLVEPGEPAFVRNLFVCWSLFVLGSSLAFYRASWADSGIGRGGSPLAILLYSGLTMGIGWAVVPALVGNWDNGLLVSLGPAMAGLARGPRQGPGYPLLLGASVAYGVYTYPELVVFAVAFVGPLYLDRLWRRPWRAQTLLAGGLVGVTVAVLLWPGVRSLWIYFERQMRAATMTTGMRPGGDFASGLVDAIADPSTWWALGGEHTTALTLSWASAGGLLLTAIALVGALQVARRGPRAEVVSLGLLAVSVGYYLVVDRYAYAAYKLLSVAWWLIGRCLVEGVTRLAGRGRPWDDAPWPRRWTALIPIAAVVLVLVIGLALSEQTRRARYFAETFVREQLSLAALTRLRGAAMRQPPTDMLVTDPLTSPSVLPWIIYILRDTPIRPYHDAALRPPIPLGRTWPADDPPPATMLTRPDRAIVVQPRFATPELVLADSATTVVILGMDNPNRFEAWGTWLGTEPITVALNAPRGRHLALAFAAAPGPSRPGTDRRTLVLASGPHEIGRVEIDGPARVVFPFVTAGGRETFSLSTPDTPTRARMPNGDLRPLLVKIQNLRIEPGDPGS